MVNARMYLATGRGVAVISGSPETWHGEIQLKGEPVRCVAIGPKHPNHVYAGSERNGVFRSEDAGKTWHFCEGTAGLRVTSLAACTGEDARVYAGTEPSAIFRSDGDGKPWVRMPAFRGLASMSQWSFPPRPETHHVRFILPDPFVPGRLHAAIEAGALLRSDDGGETWRDRVPRSPKDTHELAFHPGTSGRLYSAAGDGYFESRDDGDTWERIRDGLEHEYCWSVAIDRSDADTVLLGSSRTAREAHAKGSGSSFVYRRVRGGPWQQAMKGLPALQGRRISVVSQGTETGAFYLCTEGEIYRSETAGLGWQPIAVEWAAGSEPHHARAMSIAEY